MRALWEAGELRFLVAGYADACSRLSRRPLCKTIYTEYCGRSPFCNFQLFRKHLNSVADRIGQLVLASDFSFCSSADLSPFGWVAAGSCESKC